MNQHTRAVTASQWRTEGGRLGDSNRPTRNPEVLTKLNRIAN